MAKIKPNLSKKPKKSSDWEIVDIPIAQVGTQMGIISDPRKDAYYTQPANNNQNIQQEILKQKSINYKGSKSNPVSLPEVEIATQRTNPLGFAGQSLKSQQTNPANIPASQVASQIFSFIPEFGHTPSRAVNYGIGAYKNQDLGFNPYQSEITETLDLKTDPNNPLHSIRNFAINNAADFLAPMTPKLGNWSKELVKGSIKAGRPKLPEFQTVLRAEASGFNPSKVSPSPSLNPVQQGYTGQWLQTASKKNPGAFDEMAAYLTGLETKSGGNMQLLSDVVPWSEAQKFTGKNLPLNAKTMSFGAGEFGTLENALKQGVITKREFALLQNYNSQAARIGSSPNLSKAMSEAISKLRQNPKTYNANEMLNASLASRLRLAPKAVGSPELLSKELEAIKNQAMKGYLYAPAVEAVKKGITKKTLLEPTKPNETSKNGGLVNSNWEIMQEGGYTDWKTKYNLQETPDYNLQRAFELGYNPDETGHLPSVDSQTGEWLKSDKHPTRGMELMPSMLNPEIANTLRLIRNEEGKMQYVPKLKNGGQIQDQQGYLASNLQNFTPKKVIKGNKKGTNITTVDMAFPITANGKTLFPNTGEYYFPESSVTEYPIMQTGGRTPIIVNDLNDPRLRAYQDSLNLYKQNFNQLKTEKADGYEPVSFIKRIPFNSIKDNEYAENYFEKNDMYDNRSKGEVYPEKIKPIYFDINKIGDSTQHSAYYQKPVQPVLFRPNKKIELNSMEGNLQSQPIDLGDINPIPFEPGSYFTRKRKPQEADRGKMEYFDKKTGRSIGLYDDGGELPEAGSGYKVVRSSERKGKTHKVTGPDGTVKFFGDSKLGQHPKDPARKKAFYARHKKNLAGNPYFRAFARKTWEEGGELDNMAFGGNLILEKYQDGGSNWEIVSDNEWEII